MWFDRRIAYRKSPIHGTGTFALSGIQAGETLVWVTGGIVYTAEEYHSGKMSFDGSMYNEAKISDTHLIATPVCFHYFINHSCEPNVIDQSRHHACIHFVALRDIRADEELTADYYDESSLADCNCGSPGCRWKKRSG